MRAERHEHAAGARVHQRHAGHRELAAQGGVLDQHREALGLQRFDAFHQVRVFRQHFFRHVRQRQLFLDDPLLHRPLEDFRQALHLRLRQRVARAHAVAEVKILDQVGREPHRLAVGAALKRQRANAARLVAGIGVDQIGAAQLALGVEDRPAMRIQNLLGQLVVGAR